MPAIRQRLRDHAIARAAVGSLGVSGVALALSLVSGVIVARALNSDGRGELTSILTITTTIGWLATAGSRQTLTFHWARDPSAGPALMGTWRLIFVGLTLLGTAVAELVIPWLLQAQSDETVFLARLYALTLGGVVATDMVVGLTYGRQAHLLGNVLRVAASVVTTVLYVAFLLAGVFTLETALIANAVAFIVPPAVGFVLACASHTPTPFSPSLARSTLTFGLRGQVGSLGTLINARLDLLLMPAFLAASEIGHYAVAVSIATIFPALADGLGALTLSTTSRQPGDEGRKAVLRAAGAVFAGGALLAGLLAISAPWLVETVYGSEFESSVTLVRLLMPGAVCYATAFILIAGLSSRNQPIRGTVAQCAGMLVTLCGLVLFLKSNGAVAAALVTTASSVVVCSVALFMFLRPAVVTSTAFRPT